MRTWPLLALAGCLYLVDAPDSARCEPEECPGADGCTDHACTDRCDRDRQCKEGAVCVFGTCEFACDPEECPDGLACDPRMNACHELCFEDEECRGPFTCCDIDRYSDEACDDLHACFR